jgi:5'-methylthioadenosine phosphorylase
LLAAAPPLTLHDGAVYVNANGPRFESPAEIRAMRTLGGDVIGMTAGSEAVVMHEAGIKYAVVCAVTNLAAGLSQGELTHGEVTEAMQASMSQIFQIFERLRLS